MITLTAKERESLKAIGSLPKKKQQIIFNTMKKFFVDTGISDKDGKLISRDNLKAFQQMLAEQSKQISLSQKTSKKLKSTK